MGVTPGRDHIVTGPAGPQSGRRRRSLRIGHVLLPA
jgi:hypothetical protein